MSRTITAAAPVDMLMRALSTAQWGALDGYEMQGVRSTLRAVADLVHPRYGQATATAWDVKRGAGLSERWTRVCLHWLEDAGIIEWRRGGVHQGVPQPGFIRLIKTALVELIRVARPIKDQCQRDRNARTRQRLARLGIPTIKNKRPHFRSSDHAELSADLTHSRSGGSPKALPSSTAPDTRKDNTMDKSPHVPESVRLTRLRDEYMRTQGITTPQEIEDAHRYLGRVRDWDQQIAKARKAERMEQDELTDAHLW